MLDLSDIDWGLLELGLINSDKASATARAAWIDLGHLHHIAGCSVLPDFLSDVLLGGRQSFDLHPLNLKLSSLGEPCLLCVPELAAISQVVEGRVCALIREV